MADPTIEKWIRKESQTKAFSKDSHFIGEIRLHNVLLNQLPASMLNLGHTQQSVRKVLLHLIDTGFSAELRAESARRRRTLRDIPDTPAAVVETDVVAEAWIRKESARVAFSNEDMFIGEIRLHNVLCNSLPAGMVGNGYTPQMVRKSLLKMIDEGFSEELQNESRWRRSAAAAGPGTVGSQQGIEMTETAFPPLPGGGKSTKSFLDSLFASQTAPPSNGLPPSDPPPVPFPPVPPPPFQSSNTIPSSLQPVPLQTHLPPDPTPETPTPPFCIQHTILTALQTTLESALFTYTTQHCPPLLSRRGWTCPYSAELNSWTHELHHSLTLGELPPSSIASDTTLLKALDDLRHTAVRRVPVTGGRLLELMECARAAVRMLGDVEREEEVKAMMGVVEGCFEESRRSRSGVEVALGAQLGRLEVERRRLEERERAVREEAEKERGVVEETLKRRLVSGLGGLGMVVHQG